jgi:hypothetical protein
VTERDPLRDSLAAGHALQRLGDHEAAHAALAAVLACDPENLALRFAVAASAGFTGRVDEAIAHYKRIIAADPGHAGAHYQLALLARATREANHVDRLAAALAATRDARAAFRLRFALSKELEDLGDDAAAFAHVATAKRAQRSTKGYDFVRHARIFDAVERLMADPAALARPGIDDASAVFVLGMPRTGTTLVDRILSAHPAIASSGEIPAMPLAIGALAGPGRSLVEIIGASAGYDPAAIGRGYLARAAPHRRTAARRRVDKLPANLFNIAHIAAALPKAPIICLRRDPLDVVWSTYKHPFAPEASFFDYALDPMDIARFLVRFDRLIARAKARFPGRILELRYEALVADQAGETARLLAHVGEGWDDACLSFHANTAPIATPSAAQVRRPINAGSIGKWRAHAGALEPVARYLEAEGMIDRAMSEAISPGSDRPYHRDASPS